MTYRFEGITTMQAIFGGLLAYRELAPVDRRLAGGQPAPTEPGRPGGPSPRKTEPRYGPIVAELLRRARRLSPAAPPLRRLVYLGDSAATDGLAFRSICTAGGWTGRLFIGRDALGEPPRLEWLEPACLANRWSQLGEFLDQLPDRQFPLDAQTAVVIDVDKTTIGARGRNDHAGDQARGEALGRTAAAVLGSRHDPKRLQAAAEVLQQPLFHPLTADNQDLLAYLCLAASSGLLRLAPLRARLEQGRATSFAQILADLTAKPQRLAEAGLAHLHDEIRRAFLAGDPTPFKRFRQYEFLATAERLQAPADLPVERRLGDHLVITAEVAAAAARLRSAGALVFGLSDKPAAAVWPRGHPADPPYPPLHEIPAAAVGLTDAG